MISQLEKTADISQHLHWFPRVMTSQGRTQKFHTETRHHPDLGRAAVWMRQTFNQSEALL